MDTAKSFLKKLLTSIVFIATFGFATVTVDGYAYLENLSDHSGITVTFERTAPSALTETATTDANGLFTAQLETGIYDVTYTKDGYFSESLTAQSFYVNTTLSNITLIEHTTLINVPSLFSTIQEALNNALGDDTVLVAAGNYIENIVWPATNGIKLIGSGEGDCIIDGNQQSSVIRIENDNIDNTTIINGLTIMNGLAGGGWSDAYGGGIFCTINAGLSLENVTISNNTA